jgi:hypothetical protein
MKFWKSLLVVTAVCLAATSAFAGPGKRKDVGASNNGPNDAFSTCLTESGNCANFTSSPVSTISGVPVYNFVLNLGDGSAPSVFDVFQLPGTIAPGQTFSMTLNSLTGSYGAFACNNGSANMALSSTGNLFAGPCTPGSTDSLAGFLSETDSGNTATFKFIGGAGFPSQWAFYTDSGNLGSITLPGGGGGGTPAPEPSSLALLMAGAVAVGLLVKATR